MMHSFSYSVFFEKSMAESVLSLHMDELDVATLKYSISAQNQALQKLRAELEKEREASASAASEALSMILRLQAEKAAEKMEAHQYKRMVEEKMRYAHESLAVFEDIMRIKEMEASCLDFQVQLYRQKLASIGLIDHSIGEIKFNQHGTVRRNNSLPVMPFKGSKSKKICLERGNAISLLKNTDEYSGCVLEQIDEWVNEASSVCMNEENQSNLHATNGDTGEIKETCSMSLDRSMPSNFNAGHSERLGTELLGHSTSDTNIYDIFEVPQNKGSQQLSKPQKMKQGLFIEARKRLGNPDSVQFGDNNNHFNEENHFMNNIMLGMADQGRPSTSQNEVNTENCCPVLDSVTATTSQAEIQQLDRRLKLLENELMVVKKETLSRTEEEVELLAEIRELLKTIHSQIKKPEVRKSHSPVDLLMLSTQEAMLRCSLV